MADVSHSATCTAEVTMLELKFEHLAGMYRLVDGPKIDFEAVPREIDMEKPACLFV
jgi:hypothetical protein